MTDFDNFENTIMNEAYEIAERRVQEIAASMQNHYLTMEMNDLSMSLVRDHRYALSKVSFQVEKKDNLNYSIKVEIPEGFTDSEKELLQFYFDDSKKYVLG